MQLTQNLLTYDGARRRLWIGGQRCHHGATGAVLTARALVLATTGSLLMVHDWQDRSIWFQRGWQDQP
jgi:hypothetical protein